MHLMANRLRDSWNPLDDLFSHTAELRVGPLNSLKLVLAKFFGIKKRPFGNTPKCFHRRGDLNSEDFDLLDNPHHPLPGLIQKIGICRIGNGLFHSCRIGDGNPGGDHAGLFELIVDDLLQTLHPLRTKTLSKLGQRRAVQITMGRILAKAIEETVKPVWTACSYKKKEVFCELLRRVYALLSGWQGKLPA